MKNFKDFLFISVTLKKKLCPSFQCKHTDQVDYAVDWWEVAGKDENGVSARNCIQ